MPYTRRTRNSILLGITLLSVVLIGGAYSIGAFSTLQDQLTDRFYTPSEVRTDILIVDIDEVSLAEIGQWPWSRATHAQLLQNLSSAQIVAFDVIFSETSTRGSDDDAALATAIADFAGTAVLPQVISEQSDIVRNPLPAFADNSSLGFVNVSPERDGVVRHSQLARNGLQSFDSVIAGTDMTTEKLRITWHGPQKTFTTLSYVDVYNGIIPAEVFAGKTILVGAGAAGLGDTYQTPFGAMPGVEIHANTINTLSAGTARTPVDPVVSWILFSLVGLATVLTIIYVRQAMLMTGALGLIALLIIIGTYGAFTYLRIVPHLYLLILFVVLAVGLFLLQYIFESGEKAYIRRGFEQYVAKEVVDELSQNPDKLTLGGETKTLSILFSDIRGFTTISEQLTPQELMNQLNEYLEEMSESVMERKGLVDKYIGDAVMAFWGAPLTIPNHAALACESVIDMKRALSELNQRWEKEGKPPFAIGVGVSTGDVVVGNMGSKRRFNYSIIGDEVNFSARIEGLTKQYGVFCLIGEQTYQDIKDMPHLTTRELDDVMVKGKKEPRRIYELVTDELTPEIESALTQFAVGRKAYLAGDFTAASTAFSKALEANLEDGPSQVFLERSKELMANPPENWNGVFEFKTK